MCRKHSFPVASVVYTCGLTVNRRRGWKAPTMAVGGRNACSGYRSTQLGIHHRCLPVITDERVPLLNDIRIDLEGLVRITCLNLAKIFGVFPRQGILARGSDADIVIADRARETSISAPALDLDADWSSREGMRLKGGLLWLSPGRGYRVQLAICGRT